MLKRRHPMLGTFGMRRTLQAIAMTLASVMAANVNAFPVLNLSPGTPDIGSAFVSVTYSVNAGIGTLTARGQAQQLTPSAQGGSPNIQNADFFTSFDLNAVINNNNQTATGTLVISGETPADGFTSGTLLTGTLSAFGAGASDPLEFLFDVTGGDAAGLFGPTAGTILSFSGFGGDLLSNFSTSFTSVADTFSVATAAVPEPTALGLVFAGGLVLVWSKRRRRGHTT